MCEEGDDRCHRKIYEDRLEETRSAGYISRGGRKTLAGLKCSIKLLRLRHFKHGKQCVTWRGKRGLMINIYAK